MLTKCLWSHGSSGKNLSICAFETNRVDLFCGSGALEKRKGKIYAGIFLAAVTLCIINPTVPQVTHRGGCACVLQGRELLSKLLALTVAPRRNGALRLTPWAKRGSEELPEPSTTETCVISGSLGLKKWRRTPYPTLDFDWNFVKRSSTKLLTQTEHIGNSASELAKICCDNRLQTKHLKLVSQYITSSPA